MVFESLTGRALAVVLGLGLAPGAGGAQGSAPHPTLVVVITVDQMRGDYLRRYAAQWVGGFRRFYTEGTEYSRGLQDHASTETAPGHSTVLSGRDPAHTGIVTNSRGVPDASAPVLGMVDTVGASPRRFRGTTLYDWMLARDPDARVLSVSRKDRGAIFPVGRAKGSVYWYAEGRFTTSRYYTTTLPDWVDAFNAENGVARLAGTTWSLLRPDSVYAEPDTLPFENGGADFVFPHRLPAADTIAQRITAYPWMDSLTLAFALDGVRALALGHRRDPDLLAVSLSTTDAVGHAFGPDSREIHDQLLRVDVWLGQFCDSLARLVPGNRIVFVLTADHGVSPLPEYEVLVRHERAGRLGGGYGIASRLEAVLERRYAAEFGVTFENGLLSADVEALGARGVDVDSLSAAVASEVAGWPGVAAVYTPATLRAAPVADRGARLWRRTLPADYGWLFCAVTRPHYVWSGGSLGGAHGGATLDDEWVPIAFVGPGIPRQHVDREVRTVDIAPTLAALLGITPTEPLDGRVLSEVVSAVARR